MLIQIMVFPEYNNEHDEIVIAGFHGSLIFQDAIKVANFVSQFKAHYPNSNVMESEGQGNVSESLSLLEFITSVEKQVKEKAMIAKFKNIYDSLGVTDKVYQFENPKEQVLQDLKFLSNFDKDAIYLELMSEKIE